MTEQWKPIGDKWPQPAMVMVRKVNGHQAAISSPFATSVVDSRWVYTNHLHPMPPTITPEQQAVLDAAVRQEHAWYKRISVSSFEYEGATQDTNKAVRAMLAAQQPPDPVKELREAAKEIAEITPHASTLLPEDVRRWKRLHAAIAALEAKS